MRESGRHDVRLVAMVLAKRAFSCARSLAATLRDGSPRSAGNIGEPAQSSLLFGFEDDRSDDGRFRSRLRSTEPPTNASRSSGSSMPPGARKRATGRCTHSDGLLRRVREPLIVFTEYRDTLDAIREEIADVRTIATLHGGQSPQERSHSVCAFTTGEATYCSRPTRLRGTEPPNQLPARRQPGAPVESDAPGAAHRPRRSDRADPNGTRHQSLR